MKKKKTKKTIRLVIISLLLFYIYNMTVPLFKKDFTSIANKDTYKYSVTVKGIAVRDESIINEQKDINTVFTVQNSTKISENNVVAKKYRNIEDVVNLTKIEQIDKEMLILNDINRYSVNITSQDTVSKNIYDNINKFNKQITNENIDDISNLRQDILKSMLEKDKMINRSLDLSGIISQLNNEKGLLQQSASVNFSNVMTNESGYFVNSVDGYEDIINLNNYMKLSDNEILDLINSDNEKKENNQIGKIIKDYKWKFISLIDKNKSRGLKKGNKIEMSFDVSKKSLIEGVIFDIREIGDQVILEIDSDFFIEDISDIRVTSSQLILKNYSGIKVDKSALRIKDDEKGVYVIEKGKKIFKKLDIVFEDDYYIISKERLDESQYIKVYDEFIIN
ncbi:MAG: HlyD family efflux transporter periplasmic adaptor subunit [Oscillospiraceae bacterium]